MSKLVVKSSSEIGCINKPLKMIVKLSQDFLWIQTQLAESLDWYDFYQSND